MLHTALAAIVTVKYDYVHFLSDKDYKDEHFLIILKFSHQ